MTWLLWRQHRVQAALAGALLGALAIVLAITGTRLADAYSEATSCHVGACSIQSVLSGYDPLITLVNLTIVVPLLLGVFWGAPLIAREFESGTHTLAWTQSVSKRHWLTSKLLLLVGSTIVATAALTAVVTWWSKTANAIRGNRFDTAQFETQGIVPIAYAVFAVSLGVAAGAVLRRSLPALGVTIFVFAAVRILINNYARPYFMHPLTATTRLDRSPSITGGPWIISQDLSLHGHVVQGAVRAPTGCLETASRAGMDRCMSDQGYSIATSYQPANRYWPFQFIESGIFLALAAVLIAVCVVVVRRRDA